MGLAAAHCLGEQKVGLLASAIQAREAGLEQEAHARSGVVQCEERVRVSFGGAHREGDVFNIRSPVWLQDVLAWHGTRLRLPPARKELGYCLLHAAGRSYTTINGQYLDPPD